MIKCPDCLGEKGCYQLPYGWVMCGGCDGRGKVPNKACIVCSDPNVTRRDDNENWICNPCYADLIGEGNDPTL